MINSIPFKIPSEFTAALANGEIIRIGSLLKDSTSGRIVAHVQETGLASQVFNTLKISPLSPISDISNLGSSVYSNIQLNQIKNMIDSMQSLQYVNLGIAVAGVGVSLIGFKLINDKIKGIESQIKLLEKKLDQHFQDLFERNIREHFSRISTLFENSDIVQGYKQPSIELKNLASQFAEESGFFSGEIRHLTAQNEFNSELIISFVKSLGLCDAGRLKCQLLANELSAAHDTSIKIGENYSSLFDNIAPTNLAKQIDSNSTNHVSLQNNLIEAKSLVQGFRDITDAALTRPLLIENIINKGISGHDYVLSLANEKKRPLLLLEH